jgi:hypothetical protein
MEGEEQRPDEERERPDEERSTMKKIAKGVAVGVATAGAVGVAKKLTGGPGEGEDEPEEQRDEGQRARPTRRRQSKATRGGGRTKEQLYAQAKRLKIEGRSTMTKSELERAVARAKT